MTKNKGFTLIELMVVILIVAILAAVLAPMLTGRIREAKWTEGRAGAGTIATAIRAYCAERGADVAVADATWANLGLMAGDLQGKYFSQANYAITSLAYTASTGTFDYLITVTAPASVEPGAATKTLDETGTWSDGR